METVNRLFRSASEVCWPSARRRRARAARGGHEREGVFVTALRVLETAHACLQTAVDVSETVDATFPAAPRAAFLNVAGVQHRHSLTAAMRDLASELARRAREDAVDDRDGRVAAVEKTVASTAPRLGSRTDWAFR